MSAEEIEELPSRDQLVAELEEDPYDFTKRQQLIEVYRREDDL